VALYTPSAQAAKRATTDIPIVIISGNPLGTGLVASLARPGGNITGVSSMNTESGGKCLKLLWDLFPSVSQVAVLVHPADPFARPVLEQIQSDARGIGVRIQPVLRLIVSNGSRFRSAKIGAQGRVSKVEID